MLTRKRRKLLGLPENSRALAPRHQWQKQALEWEDVAADATGAGALHGDGGHPPVAGEGALFSQADLAAWAGGEPQQLQLDELVVQAMQQRRRNVLGGGPSGFSEAPVWEQQQQQYGDELAMLAEMGFEVDGAQRALQATRGDVQAAVQLLSEGVLAWHGSRG